MTPIYDALVEELGWDPLDLVTTTYRLHSGKVLRTVVSRPLVRRPLADLRPLTPLAMPLVPPDAPYFKGAIW